MKQPGCLFRLRVHPASRPLHPATPRLRLFSTNLPAASLSSPSSRLASGLPVGSSYLPQTINSLLRDGPSSQGRVETAEAALAEATETAITPSAVTTATINGWIKSIRKMGKIVFAHVSDGSTLTPVQVVLMKTQAAGLSTGSSVQVTGLWKPAPPGTEQRNELEATEITVLGAADPATYPLQKKYQTPEFLRSLSHLRPRIPSNAALLRLRSQTSSILTSFFNERDFTQVYPPLITSSDCEGGGETFAVTVGSSLPTIATAPAAASTPARPKKESHFFKSPKYLTVSSQLHLEALSTGVSRVWTMSPTFRAERSDTNRHLSEFYMLEAEVSFVYTLTPLLDLVEDMIRTTVTQLRESRIGSEVLAHPPHSSPELEAAGLIPEPLVNKWDVLTPTTAWPRLTYSAAMKLLAEQHSTGKVVFQHTPDWADGLHSEHERFLAAHYNAPVFVTDYPSHIKPFYMLPTTDPAAVEEAEGRPTVACFDLLLPGIGELVGGSLRIHDLEMLKSEMIKRGMMKENGKGAEGMKWYEDLRRWGSVPHGGFGLGVERLMAYLGGVENVREVSAFPRWVGRCDC